MFTGVTDTAYLPINSDVRLTSPAGGTIALPGARADRALPFRFQPASQVDVSLRGSGSSTRQVNNFGMGAGMECVKMLATEVLTPASNWSSYPPHKHDEDQRLRDRTGRDLLLPVRLGRAGRRNRRPAVPKPLAINGSTARPSGPSSCWRRSPTATPCSVPHGWHGPSIAAPSHHMYYLNVMAGPGAERAWGISDDPNHGWVRATWADQPTDPRLPFYTAPAGPDHPIADPPVSAIGARQFSQL